MAIGRKTWATGEGYIPSGSVSQAHDLVSHEALRLLNAGEDEASIRLMLYFEDRNPAGPYLITLAGRRTLHLRLNDLKDPEPVPRDTSYAMMVESTVPIVVQHTRLDSRDPHIALLSTIAFPVE